MPGVDIGTYDYDGTKRLEGSSPTLCLENPGNDGFDHGW